MRTLRTQKQVKQKRGITFDTNATFSVFEDFEPKVVNIAVYPDNEPWIKFPAYDASTDLSEQLGAEGVKAVKEFSEELSNRRYNCMKASAENPADFYLTLLVMQQDVDVLGVGRYHAITFHFYKKDDVGVADLIVEQNDTKKVGTEDKIVLRKIKEMLVDSDTNEALTRFVAKQEWESTTYAILDANVNLGIYKNVHLTLNAPFNCNMKWYVPNRKLVYGYKFTDEYPVYPKEQP